MALLKFKRSATPSKVPTTSDLALGELALNTYDGKVYMKKDDGTQAIVEVGGTSGGGTVTSVDVSGGTTGLTFSGGPVTSSGTITQGGTLNVANGGTGATSLTSGYVLKGNGTSPLSASVIYDNGTNVGIGTTSPSQKLQVQGASLILPAAGWSTGNTAYLYLGDSNNGVSSTFGNPTNVFGFHGVTFSAQGSQLGSFDTSGNGYATASFRAPIFYDSANTAYYLDPTGSTSLNAAGNLLASGNLILNHGANRYVRIGSSTNYSYNLQTTGDDFQIIEAGTTPRLTIKYPSGSVGIGTSSPTGLLSVASTSSAGTTISSWTSAHSVFGPNVGSTTGAALGLGYNTTTDTAEIVSIAPNVAWKNMLLAAVTIDLQTISGRVQTNQSFRAPIFYDSDDTAYYIDPTSNSHLRELRIGTSAGAINQTGIIKEGGATYGLGLFTWGDFAPIQIGGGSVTFAKEGGAGISVTSVGDFRAPIFYDSANTGYYVDPAGTSQLVTVQTSGGSGFRSFATPSASVNSQLYFADAGNTRAWNWQLDENNDAALWNYNGSAWSKRVTVTTGSEIFLRNSFGNDLSLAYPSVFGYSSAYRTTVIGNQAYNTVCIGVSPASNASGSFNGNGEGREVMFRNGVNFITPNSANNSYLNPLNMTDGYVTSSGSFRAPIFYDSNDTAYYTDPASTSVLNALAVNGGAVYRSDWTTRFQSSSDFVNGTLVSTDIPATASAGDSFVIEITGKSYSASNPPFKAVAQGYLYNNTIINFSGINYGGEFSSYIRVFEDGGVLKFWWPRISYWNSFNVNVMSMDSATNGTITRNRVTSITNSTEPTGSKKQTINLAGFMRSDISATNSVDLRAPRFYDSDNTAYYVDPASTSNVNAMVSYSYQGNGNVGGTGSASWHPSGIYSAGYNWLYGGISAGGGDISSVNSVFANVYYDNNNTSYYVDPTSTASLRTVGDWRSDSSAWTGEFAGKIQYHNNSWYLQFSNSLIGRRNDGADLFVCNSSGQVSASGDFRAPIFYDSNNTGYYVDPNSVTNIWQLKAKGRYNSDTGGSAIYIGDGVSTSDGLWINFHTDADTAYRIGKPAGAWTQPLEIRFYTGIYHRAHQGYGGHRFYNYSGNSLRFSVADGDGDVRSLGNFRAPLMYDIDNTAYYCNPASVSELGVVVGNGGFFYDPAGGGTGTDTTTTAAFAFPRGSRIVGTVDGYIRSMLEWDASANINIGQTSTALIAGIRLNAGGSGFTQATGSLRAPIFYDSNNTGRYADLASTGDSIRASGDIVAYYSDDRLKDRGDNIANALDKVQSLNGFHYTANETAQKFGYKAHPQVGVSAQEVEAILPEVVKDAAIGHGYKTVDYAKLVPLLIEAIKELKAEVETLKKG